MLAYIVRRVLYAIPILIGINLITFALFFLVNTPDDMARMQLGQKRVTPEAIGSAETILLGHFLRARSLSTMKRSTGTIIHRHATGPCTSRIPTQSG